VTCPLGQTVPFPSGDATTPDPVNMDANFPAQPMQSVSNTTGAVTAKIINQPVITFIASGGDPQGMGDIQIWIEETWWRNNPDGTVTQTGPGLPRTPGVLEPSHQIAHDQPGVHEDPRQRESGCRNPACRQGRLSHPRMGGRREHRGRVYPDRQHDAELALIRMRDQDRRAGCGSIRGGRASIATAFC